jgi:hypothetical protein
MCRRHVVGSAAYGRPDAGRNQDNSATDVQSGHPPMVRRHGLPARIRVYSSAGSCWGTGPRDAAVALLGSAVLAKE